MVAKVLLSGLIATTRDHASPALRDLARHCEWPLILSASPRGLYRELSLHDPGCVLFWLDDQFDVAATARLISWLHQRGPRPYRVAVAHCLEGDVEAVLRTSGAHSFLLLTGQRGSIVADALRPLLSDVACATRASPESVPLVGVDDRAASSQSVTDFVRPP